MSVTIKQLKAPLFNSKGPFNSRHNRTNNFFFELESTNKPHNVLNFNFANGLRNEVHLNFSNNTNNERKKRPTIRLNHIFCLFVCLRLCVCVFRMCHSKAIISSCKWATKSETNMEKITQQIYINLYAENECTVFGR